MLLNTPTFPTFYTFNDVVRKTENAAIKTIELQKNINELTIACLESLTDGYLTTYTKKMSTFNTNMAEDAKKIIQTGTQTVSGNTAEDQAFERDAAASAVGAMRQNAQYMASGKDKETRRYDINAPAEGERRPQAALPAMSPTEYTKAKGMEDYVKAAGQISRKGTLEAIQLKQVVRQSENEDKFFRSQEKLNDDLAAIQGAGESFGLKGVYDVASKNGLKNLKFVEGISGLGIKSIIKAFPMLSEGELCDTESMVEYAESLSKKSKAHELFLNNLAILERNRKLMQLSEPTFSGNLRMKILDRYNEPTTKFDKQTFLKYGLKHKMFLANQERKNMAVRRNHIAGEHWFFFKIQFVLKCVN